MRKEGRVKQRKEKGEEAIRGRNRRQEEREGGKKRDRETPRD